MPLLPVMASKPPGQPSPKNSARALCARGCAPDGAGKTQRCSSEILAPQTGSKHSIRPSVRTGRECLKRSLIPPGKPGDMRAQETHLVLSKVSAASGQLPEARKQHKEETWHYFQQHLTAVSGDNNSRWPPPAGHRSWPNTLAFSSARRGERRWGSHPFQKTPEEPVTAVPMVSAIPRPRPCPWLSGGRLPFPSSRQHRSGDRRRRGSLRARCRPGPCRLAVQQNHSTETQALATGGPSGTRSTQPAAGPLGAPHGPVPTTCHHRPQLPEGRRSLSVIAEDTRIQLAVPGPREPPPSMLVGAGQTWHPRRGLGRG